MTHESKTGKNSQECARDLLEIAWARCNQANSEKRAVERAQSSKNSAKVEQLLWSADADWPEFPIELLIGFEQQDLAVLLSDLLVDADSFVGHLTDIWFEEMVEFRNQDPSWQENKYLRSDGRLRGLVENRLNRRFAEREPCALVDEVFERAASERLGSTSKVKESVLQSINDRLINACRNAPNGPTARRALKIFTVLTTESGQCEERVRILKNLKRGDTSELPYVIRNLRPNTLPKIASIGGPAAQVIPGDAFPDELLAAVPEFSWVLEATRAFLERRGVLERYLDIEGSVADDLASPFSALPDLVQRNPGGIVMNKTDALQVNRHERYSLPDGVACSVSIIAALEWILHQAAAYFEMGVNDKIQVAKTIAIVDENVQFRDEIKDGLARIFSKEGLSIRDSIAHSAFVADDRSKLEVVINGLLNIMMSLLDDLKSAGQFVPILEAPRWDSEDPITPESAEAMRAQHQGQLNIISQLSGDQDRAHVFKVLKYVTPDKATIGRASILFWNEVERGEEVDSYMALVGLIAAFVTCEELFRAVLEIHEMNSIALYSDSSDSAKVELVYFDPKEGHLLDKSNLTTLFPEEMKDPNFYEALSAMRSVRDCLFHGKLSVLQHDLLERFHIVIKIIFALCSSVDVRTEGGEQRLICGSPARPTST